MVLQIRQSWKATYYSWSLFSCDWSRDAIEEANTGSLFPPMLNCAQVIFSASDMCSWLADVYRNGKTLLNCGRARIVGQCERPRLLVRADMNEPRLMRACICQSTTKIKSRTTLTCNCTDHVWFLAIKSDVAFTCQQCLSLSFYQWNFFPSRLGCERQLTKSGCLCWLRTSIVLFRVSSHASFQFIINGTLLHAAEFSDYISESDNKRARSTPVRYIHKFALLMIARVMHLALMIRAHPTTKTLYFDMWGFFLCNPCLESRVDTT